MTHCNGCSDCSGSCVPDPIVPVVPTTDDWFAYRHCINCAKMAPCDEDYLCPNCSGSCASDPVVPVAPKELHEMTVSELRTERVVARRAGNMRRTGLISVYISGAYAAQRAYDDLQELRGFYNPADLDPIVPTTDDFTDHHNCPYCDPYALSGGSGTCPACGD